MLEPRELRTAAEVRAHYAQVARRLRAQRSNPTPPRLAKSGGTQRAGQDGSRDSDGSNLDSTPSTLAPPPPVPPQIIVEPLPPLRLPRATARVLPALHGGRKQRDPLRRTSEIIAVTAACYRLTPADIIGKARRRHLCAVRHVAIYVSWRLLRNSLPQIGREFGGRDHSTILSALNRVATGVAHDPLIAAVVDRLTAHSAAVIGHRWPPE
jgi:hypothetical protein